MKKYIVLQEEASDCGACCLCSLIKYYQGYVPLEIVRIDTSTTKEGTSFYNLKQAALKYGFDVIGSKETFKDIATPVIAQVKIDEVLLHFLVIYKITKKHVICMEPSKGIIKYSHEEFNNIFMEYLLYLKPINKIVKYDDTNILTCFLKKCFIKYKKSYFLIFIITLLIISVSIVTTFLLNSLFVNNEIKVILILALLYLFQEIISLFKLNLTAILSEKFNKDLIVNYLEHVFNLPLKYLQLKYPGEFTKRVQELENIKDLFSNVLLEALLNILFVIFPLIVIIILNFKLSLIILLLTSIYILFNLVYYKKIYKNIMNLFEIENLYLNNIIEYINKISNIKLLRISNFINHKLDDVLLNKFKSNYKLNKNISFSNFISSMYSHICILIIFIYSYQFSNQFLIFLFMYQYLNNSIKYLTSLIPNILYFKEVYSRVSAIFYLPKDNLENSFSLDGNLKIINLNYHRGEKVVLNNLNLTINKGSKVLLKGENGSGKSTLLNIIYHNIIDYHGSVFLNDNLLNESYFKNLNQSIGFITQNEQLFNMTVKENIILDLPYNEEKYLKIIKMVYLETVINNSIYKDYTQVNNNFSGGEIQRIVLARVLYRNYNILFLDEALNQIDQDLKEKIIKNLNNYYKNKTIIYVNHGKDNLNYDLVINLTARKELYAK